MKHVPTVLAAFILLQLAACAGERTGSSDTADPAATAPAPATREAAAAVDAAADVVYLDVRTPAEYADGHVDGTLHIPVDQLARRIGELEPYRDRHIVVYCRTGRRSANAIELLAARGFGRLENGGGLTDMAARGLTVSRSTAP